MSEKKEDKTAKKKLTRVTGAPVVDNQNAMTAAQKQALFDNTGRAMGDSPREIKIRHVGNCLKADPAYGQGVAKALGIALSEVPKGK